MESNSITGQISESQGNLILQHHQSSVFQKSYLSRYITSDTQAVYRGLAPQTDVIRVASGMSRTIVRRRPIALSDYDLGQLRRRPELQLLRRRIDKTKARIIKRFGSQKKAKGAPIHQVYCQSQRNYLNTLRRMAKARLAKLRQDFKTNQPVVDIERQLSGQLPDSKAVPGTPQYSFTERKVAVEALLTFAAADADRDVEGCDRAQRYKAIHALSRLAVLREGRTRRPCKPTQKDSPFAENDSAITELNTYTIPSHDPQFPIRCHPTQCIVCLGTVNLPMDLRTRSFYAIGDLKKHFDRKHRKFLSKYMPKTCPYPSCYAVLDDLTHFQNHAATVHGTKT